MSVFCKPLFVACLSLGLVACGGGGGGDVGNSVAAPINVVSGIFNLTTNTDEVVTALASEAWVTNPATPNWFAYHFSTNNNTLSLDLYSARVTGVGSGQASGATLKHFQGSPISGALSLSMAQDTRLSSQLTFSNPLENRNWLTDALSDGQYSPAGTASNLNGSWTGVWYFGVNSSGKSLTLNSGNMLGQNVLTHCDFDVGSQLTPLNGANLYLANLYIKVNTQCTSLNSSNTQSAPYQGLAFVVNNPKPGYVSELVIMAVNPGPEHQALFFRGYQ
jgi:hypothetical protein